jgi:5-carboxymethyl-2-hydroxymuconic-semialdehyde dehydrogenase/aminomuconate-semialdehyde/2-hydroxymuconate-6-semialdehyde dehydrogenase
VIGPSTTIIQHRIAGQDVLGAGAHLAVVNPATGAEIGHFAEANAAQVGDAVACARTMFDEGIWAHSSVAHRQQVLRRAAGLIRAAAGELAQLQTRETGIPIGSARRQAETAAAWFDYYADYLSFVGGDVYRQIGQTAVLVDREPIGVCALFSPWNVPLGLSAIKLAPALAAGNSVILKPSELSAICTRRLVDLVEAAGLPPGVLNCVNGRGSVTGAALAEARGVDMISFTGGADGGRAVAAAAARRPIPCILELGGKSATIVLADADLDEAVPGALRAIYGNNGEACLAGSRIIVERAIAETFFTRFADAAQDLRVGDPNDAATELGPMISAAHRARILGFCEAARSDGDALLFGGKVPSGRENGFYVEATGIRIGSNTSRVWRQEIFGPVAAFASFDDDDEAVRFANDSDYGLAGYIWSRDLDRALGIARRVRTGTIVINQSFIREANAPFGGFKASGIGREGGDYSWHNVTQPKTTVIAHR